jgi:diadenosine tetraphosphate (Ap4A) HIT family hydrolase
VQGFNFGSNIGAAAGQMIFHAHVHQIPRRSGDVPLAPVEDTRERKDMLTRRSSAEKIERQAQSYSALVP